MRVGMFSSALPSMYPPPPPCISYANVRNYYGPYAHCSLDKGVAYLQSGGKSSITSPPTDVCPQQVSCGAAA